MFKHVKRLANIVRLGARKRAPELWLGAGIVLMVADVGIAVYAGTQLERTVKPDYETVKMNKQRVKEAEDAKNEPALTAAKTDLRSSQGRALKNMMVLATPVIVLNGLSALCFFKSYKTLKVRQLNAVMAYNALLEAYTAYRTNVVLNNGEVADVMALNSVTEAPLSVDPETGEEFYAGLQSTGSAPANIYGRVFNCDTSKLYAESWNQNPQWVINFLNLARQNAERKLNEVGFVSLADVLLSIGLPCEAYTYVHGWHKDGKEHKIVTFGFEDWSPEMMKRWNLGETDSIMLKFNCDGLIVDYINELAREEYDERL